MQVKRGRRHQGSDEFSPFNGIQCTAIAFMFLVLVGTNHLDLQSIDEDGIDHSLFEGTALHAEIASQNQISGYLGHEHMPGSMVSFREHFQTYIDIFYGVVGQDGNLEAGSLSLFESIIGGMTISPYMMFTAGGFTVAVIVEPEQNIFTLFDSHQRDSYGFPSSTGNAIVMMFNDVSHLHTYLQSMYGGQSFQISPVCIIDEGHENESTVEDMIAGSLVGETSFVAIDEIRTSVSSSVNFHSEEKVKTTKRKAVRKDKRCQKKLKHQCDSCNKSSTVQVGFNRLNSCLSAEHKQSKSEIQYNQYIQSRPVYSCMSCDTFLFDEKIKMLKTNVSIGSSHFTTKDHLCNFCHSKLSKSELPSTNSRENCLFPGRIPKCLQGLTTMEQRLISKIQVFITLLILPGGQFAEKGLCIDFPVNDLSILNVLPKDASSSVVIIGSKSSQPATKHNIVRKDAIATALKWLQQNNVLYQNIYIDHLYQNMCIDDPCPDCTVRSAEPNQICPDKLQVGNVTEKDSDIDEISFTPVDNYQPNIDLISFISKGVPSIVLPKYGSKPVFAFDLDGGEESSFPCLYPLGINGIRNERQKKITNNQYFHHRLYYKDGRFRKNIGYLFHAVNEYERRRLLSELTVHIRMRKPQRNGEKTNRLLSAGDVMSLESNPDLFDNSYMFMKNIRGTVAYWKNNLQDLLSMIKVLGPPSLFMSLSSNDHHWPELAMSLTGCTYEEAIKMKNLNTKVREDPFMSALHFERRFEALMKYIIKGKDAPLGKIRDHFARVEFQMRGSPHVHMFFWTDMPKVDDEEILSYIDKVICTELPDEKVDPELYRLVKSLQTHSHKPDYCLKRSGLCRFGFPYRVCRKTQLMSNVDIASNQTRGRFYETKRSENSLYINAYNPMILRHFRSNMDLQIVGKAESVAYYVCAYLLKSEPQGLKFALSELMQNMNKQESPPSQRTKLLKIGFAVLKHRALSAQEAAYRLSDLKLIHSSRKVVRLNTKPLCKRYKVLKSKKAREELEPTSTDIFEKNIVDYYRARPDKLEELNLHEFAQWYSKCPVPLKPLSKRAQVRYMLKAPLQHICIRKRTQNLVLRTSKIEISNDDYFYSLLFQFLPHRKECELLANLTEQNKYYDTAKEAFIAKKDKLIDLKNTETINQIEQAVQYIRYSQFEMSQYLTPAVTEYDIEEGVSSSLYSEGQEFDDVQVEDLLLDGVNENPHSDHSDSRSDYGDVHRLEVSIMSQDQLLERIRKLNSDQLKVMQAVKDHYHNKESQDSLKMFLTGNGGVGKSFLTVTVIEWIRACTAKFIGQDPCIVCGPTGTAARNIFGETLHHALSLPVQHGYQAEYTELKGPTLARLRKKFASIHTMIIDEISMVSSCNFLYIHRRLSSIMDDERPFGNLNLIVIGDFLQLRPVRGYFAFEQTVLWHLFEPYTLKQNVRQGGQTRFTELLNRARIGALNAEDIEIIQSRQIALPCSPDKILHIFPTIKMVEAHNKKMQRMLNCEIHRIEAFHYFSNNDLNSKDIVSDNFIPSDDRDAGGLPKCLEVSTGTRVILLRNIYTSLGLVNGAIGYVHSLEFSPGKSIPKVIYVKFDDSDIGRVLQSKNHENAIAIEPIAQCFIFKGRSIVREQFPLQPAWSLTIHKIQGASVQRIAVSLGEEVFQRGMSYVALSRVTSIDGLYVLDFDPNKVKPNAKALEEHTRLSKIERDRRN